MKILSAQQIKELDQYTIDREPISSIDLMERASMNFTRWFMERYYKEQRVIVFCGPGNNGGDGLAISRMLKQRMYPVETYVVHNEQQSDDFKINHDRLLPLLPIRRIFNEQEIPAISEDCVVIDAIFGSGLNKPIEGLFARVIEKINEAKVTVVSVDVPSGLYIDRHADHSDIIHADYTVTFQLPKLCLLLPQNYKYVGEWFMLNIGLHRDFIQQAESKLNYIDDLMIKSLLKKRPKYSHKGTFGNALIISGSYGMLGASVLAAKGCLRAGAGLVKSYVPESGFFVLQNDLPEVIVMTDPHPEIISEIPSLEDYDAIAVGPGMGEKPETQQAFAQLLDQVRQPLVIDASGLNILALNPHLWSKIPVGSILTPHPKEFERLAGNSNNDFERLEKARAMAAKYNVYILIKGAHTVICTPENDVYFNSTGNPGMATAGSGDVLTGIITSLVAQGYSSYEAIILGVYLHGYAGDAAARKNSQASMIASDIIESISFFYKDYLKL